MTTVQDPPAGALEVLVLNACELEVDTTVELAIVVGEETAPLATTPQLLSPADCAPSTQGPTRSSRKGGDMLGARRPVVGSLDSGLWCPVSVGLTLVALCRPLVP